MNISVFEIFKIGIGPSSSHTVGPMKAANQFIDLLLQDGQLENVTRLQVELFGSLALTGKGHGTDKAVLMGLLGEKPDTVDADTVDARVAQIKEAQQINLNSLPQAIQFNYEQDLVFHYLANLPHHTNGMRFSAFIGDQIFKSQEYYSIGGGFIVTAEEFGQDTSNLAKVPYPFETAQELLEHCKQNQLSISELMLVNEKTWRSEKDIRQNLLKIADVMHGCIEKGCRTDGILPGGLNVRRRAANLYRKLSEKDKTNPQHTDVMNWLNLFAMAVNEENAAGGRIVTAPTNGAAGIIPAVLQYYKDFCNGTEDGVVRFLLTAAAIGILYKLRASISGAEVGCQGEVGVACSMAAGALAEVLGGTLEQVENAAEIGMEHNLGLPCDPPKGLVQIPCIERNAMGAIKAVNAARLALAEDGQHKVSLDTVIATMRQIGIDMMAIYKETSLGGLAVNVIEC